MKYFDDILALGNWVDWGGEWGRKEQVKKIH